MNLDETHDPALRSFVASANAPDGDFPIQNLPFAVFRMRGEKARVGVAIGDTILDVAACAGLLDGARRDGGGRRRGAASQRADGARTAGPGPRCGPACRGCCATMPPGATRSPGISRRLPRSS